ncbi:hypothetical protein D3C83_255850 [compost metagenome]
MTGMPTAAAAARNLAFNGRGERRSATLSGPPIAWNSDAPRSLFSDFMKYGRTSSQPQPVAPAAFQRS